MQIEPFPSLIQTQIQNWYKTRCPITFCVARHPAPLRLWCSPPQCGHRHCSSCSWCDNHYPFRWARSREIFVCLLKAVVLQESVLQAAITLNLEHFLWDNTKKAFLSLCSHEEFRYSEAFSFFAYSKWIRSGNWFMKNPHFLLLTTSQIAQ